MRNPRLTLSALSRELRARGVNVSYQALWRSVAAGEIPAERGSRVWTVAAADVPGIADTLRRPAA